MAGEQKTDPKAPQGKGVEPGPLARDPGLLALSWATSLIAASVAYYILKHDAVASLGVGFAVATVLLIVKWKIR